MKFHLVHTISLLYFFILCICLIYADYIPELLFDIPLIDHIAQSSAKFPQILIEFMLSVDYTLPSVIIYFANIWIINC